MKMLKPLTIERLRSFAGFENVSDEEASNILTTTKDFAVILYSIYKGLKEKHKGIRLKKLHVA